MVKNMHFSRIMGIILNKGIIFEKDSLILVNGLAGQAETWFRNIDYWRSYFDVHSPEYIVYEGPVIQERIKQRLPITVDFLVSQLALFLDNFVQIPPYHLVGSSLGGQVAAEYACKNPDKVGKLVLVCPSGMGGEERLPIVEGVSRYDHEAIIGSVFHHGGHVNERVVDMFEKRFNSKEWRKGAIRTVKGTNSNRIIDKLPLIKNDTLIICGRQDQVVDTDLICKAVEGLDNFKVVILNKCGHAPQIELAGKVNRMVKDFLMDKPIKQ